MMCAHLLLEINPYAIRSRYWCDSLVETKSMYYDSNLCYVTSYDNTYVKDSRVALENDSGSFHFCVAHCDNRLSLADV